MEDRQRAVLEDRNAVDRARVFGRLQVLQERSGGPIVVYSVSELRDELKLRGEMGASVFGSCVWHLNTGDYEKDRRPRIRMMRRDPTVFDRGMSDKGALVITVL